jgi:hypothetical protein
MRGPTAGNTGNTRGGSSRLSAVHTAAAQTQAPSDQNFDVTIQYGSTDLNITFSF